MLLPQFGRWLKILGRISVFLVEPLLERILQVAIYFSFSFLSFCLDLVLDLNSVLLISRNSRKILIPSLFRISPFRLKEKKLEMAGKSHVGVLFLLASIVGVFAQENLDFHARLCSVLPM
jgi:hypothetical protein